MSMYSNLDNEGIFNKLDSLMILFIWNRFELKKMFLQRSSSFQRYCWLCNIYSVLFWVSTKGTRWSGMENESCYPSSFKALFSSSHLKTKDWESVVSHCVKIWSQIRNHQGWADVSFQSIDLHQLQIFHFISGIIMVFNL